MSAKAYKGMGMEGAMARWYEKTTRKSLAEFQSLAQRMAEGLPDGAQVLEVAPGPGFFAIALAKLGNYDVTGLDISRTFVEIARRNAREEMAQVDFQQGDAAHMPFEDDRFDLVLCRAAFKNFSEPVKALAEMRRVLRPGGKAVVIDLKKDTPQKEIDAHIDQMNAGFANSLFMKWTFRLMLLRRAYAREDFQDFVLRSGWQRYEIAEAPVGFEATLVK
jgi:ubiquinone/menaquinone biosynthesis C-methylase UbiE